MSRRLYSGFGRVDPNLPTIGLPITRTDETDALSQYRQTITDLYNEVLGRAPEKGGLNFWVNQLASGIATPAQIKQALLGSQEEKDLQAAHASAVLAAVQQAAAAQTASAQATRAAQAAAVAQVAAIQQGTPEAQAAATQAAATAATASATAAAAHTVAAALHSTTAAAVVPSSLLSNKWLWAAGILGVVYAVSE